MYVRSFPSFDFLFRLPPPTRPGLTSEPSSKLALESSPSISSILRSVYAMASSVSGFSALSCKSLNLVGETLPSPHSLTS